MLRFKSLGHMVSHIPVISIQKVIYESIDFSLFKGIIFTSSNAIKFLDTKKIDKTIKCFCVGNATEKVAKMRGFQNIYVADGNVENLNEIIFKNFGASDGNLIYVTGQIISSDLDKKLISEGYNLKRIVNYKATEQKKFNNDEIEKLKDKMPDIVYVYSKNSALSFLNMIKNYNLQSSWMNTNLMCISEKTSTVLNEIKWKKIFLFNPGEEEFLLYKI
ncbi:MAG: uroporphyrinogen-III synthase [Pseudomonadota bacterium]|nr:uroporphyrinogen-III synthase [Pseudomonadota bacterium]